MSDDRLARLRRLVAIERDGDPLGWREEQTLLESVPDLLAERDRLAAENERLRDLIDAVEDDLGGDYLAALTEESDHG
jgi:hypothetical protein